MTFDRETRLSLFVQCGMHALLPDRLFRLAGVLACLNVMLPQLVRAARVGGAIGLASAVIQVVLGGLFVTAFWAITRAEYIEVPTRRTRALFTVQVLIALAVNHYFFIVAATSAWVFPPKTARRWLVVQLALFLIAALVPLWWLSLGPLWVGLGVFVPDAAAARTLMAIPTIVVYLACWQIFAFASGYFAISERRARRALEQSARELVATQQMLAESNRVAERAQISRDLHDSLGHSLTVLNVNLELASHLTGGLAAEAIANAQTVGRVMMADVREVVSALGVDRAIDLKGALLTLAGGANVPAVHLGLPEGLTVTNPTVAHAVFRCVQEALTNAMRHGHASHVWVDVKEEGDRLAICVRDDGRGAATVREGHGLQGMRERFETVGGSCRTDTTPGRGFTLEAWVPAQRNAS